MEKRSLLRENASLEYQLLGKLVQSRSDHLPGDQEGLVVVGAWSRHEVESKLHDLTRVCSTRYRLASQGAPMHQMDYCYSETSCMNVKNHGTRSTQSLVVQIHKSPRWNTRKEITPTYYCMVFKINVKLDLYNSRSFKISAALTSLTHSLSFELWTLDTASKLVVRLEHNKTHALNVTNRWCTWIMENLARFGGVVSARKSWTRHKILFSFFIAAWILALSSSSPDFRATWAAVIVSRPATEAVIEMGRDIRNSEFFVLAMLKFRGPWATENICSVSEWLGVAVRCDNINSTFTPDSCEPQVLLFLSLGAGCSLVQSVCAWDLQDFPYLGFSMMNCITKAIMIGYMFCRMFSEPVVPYRPTNWARGPLRKIMVGSAYSSYRKVCSSDLNRYSVITWWKYFSARWAHKFGTQGSSWIYWMFYV